jgi:hypothetical protein
MEITKAKKLKEGGYALYGVDPKTKQEMQVGYIGEGLPLDGYLPKGLKIENSCEY